MTIIPTYQGAHLHELNIEDDERGLATVRVGEVVLPASGETMIEVVLTVTAPCSTHIVRRAGDGIEPL